MPVILWLASFPRSGNTFSRIVLDKAFGVMTLGEDDYHDDGGEPIPSHPEKFSFYSKIGLRSASTATTLATLQASNTPFALKTHSLHRSLEAPSIYLVRDGRDALVSYAYFALAIEQRAADSEIDSERLRDTLRNLLLDPSPDFGGWSENVNAWINRPQVAVVRFEDLIAEPIRTLGDALSKLHVDVECCSVDVPSFSELKTAVPKFFRFGSSRNWMEQFPEDLLAIFWDLHGETMSRLGYKEYDCKVA